MRSHAGETGPFIVCLTCIRRALSKFHCDSLASKFPGRGVNCRLPDSKSCIFPPTLQFPGFLLLHRGSKCMLVLSTPKVMQRLLTPWILVDFIVIWLVLSAKAAPFRAGLLATHWKARNNCAEQNISHLCTLCTHGLLWLAWCEEGSSFRFASRSTPTLLKKTENW